ncbi:hypothetical protein HanPSC8_Chr09g0396171 [Helianthus annuus]|nr:hypothetical protein HanPSC8_Chr09g0396171 [Helianthus annuus]
MVAFLNSSPNSYCFICRTTTQQIRYNTQTQYGLNMPLKRTHDHHAIIIITLLPNDNQPITHTRVQNILIGA